MKFGAHFHVPQSLNCNNFYDPLTFLQLFYRIKVCTILISLSYAFIAPGCKCIWYNEHLSCLILAISPLFGSMYLLVSGPPDVLYYGPHSH